MTDLGCVTGWLEVLPWPVWVVVAFAAVLGVIQGMRLNEGEAR